MHQQLTSAGLGCPEPDDLLIAGMLLAAAHVVD
jgi:hypothetical protein